MAILQVQQSPQRQIPLWAFTILFPLPYG